MSIFFEVRNSVLRGFCVINRQRKTFDIPLHTMYSEDLALPRQFAEVLPRPLHYVSFKRPYPLSRAPFILLYQRDTDTAFAQHHPAALAPVARSLILPPPSLTERGGNDDGNETRARSGV